MDASIAFLGMIKFRVCQLDLTIIFFLKKKGANLFFLEFFGLNL